MTRAYTFAGLLILAFVTVGSSAARAQDPANSSSQGSGTSAGSGPGSASGSSAASAPAAGATSAKPKPKKVWTNDNVGEAGGTISVVGSASSNKSPAGPSAGVGAGSAKARPAGTSAAAKPAVDPKIVAALRDQLQKLQAQLSNVDRQLADLKAASRGESKNTGGVRQDTWSYDSSSMEEQIQHLQDKKKKIETTIDQLFDAARKSGIEPGDLR
jgi:uncharacterized protein YukE